MNSTIKKVNDTVFENKMILPCDRILVGFSGGADSLFLLLALIELKKIIDFDIYAAHLNHGIRAAEADNDENFASDICKALNIEFFSKRVDIPQISAKEKISEEIAGRNERYSFFNELCKKHNINKIAVAHNKNDSVETVILNMIRGSSLKGLCGIKYVNGNIIRPILDVSRDEIEEYLTANNQEFCTDSTNLQNIYTRNKIRNSILKSMSEINPSVIETVFSNIKHLNDDEDFLNNYCHKLNCITEHNDEIIINKCIFAKQHTAIKSRIILNAFEKIKGNCNNITTKHIEIICNATESGRIYNMPDDIIVKTSYDKIIFSKNKICKNEFYFELDSEGSCILPDGSKILCKHTNECDFTKKNAVFLNADIINNKKIIVRNKINGDKFVPYGMKSEKKLKQFFNDIKIPPYDRNNVPIILIENEIAAILPYRISDKYKVTDNTKNILEIHYTKEEDGYVK